MANVPTDLVYASARDAFTEARIAWPDLTTVKCALLGAGYVPQFAHKFMSDLPASTVLARSDAVTDLANSNGICRGAIPEFKQLLLAQPVVAMVLFIDSGDDTTSELLYYSSAGVGFPFDAQGFDYFVGYDLANGGWFQI